MSSPTKLRLDLSFPKYWSNLHRFLIGRLAQSFETYHPVSLGNQQINGGARICADRWTILELLLKQHDAKSLLDLGCAEGYFVLRAAAKGYLAVGVDADVRRITIAQNVSTLDRITGAGFIYSPISIKTTPLFPSADIVLFLSVLHHVMYEHGLTHATELMKIIKSKARKGILFDMGHSNETTHRWAKLLPAMLPDPTTWISNFLSEVGFSEVVSVGITDAYQSNISRPLFFCRP